MLLHELDLAFFEDRYAVAGPAGQRVLEAMARHSGAFGALELRHALPDSANVDSVICRLVKRGLIYRPSRGLYDFALPLFRAYLQRRANLTELARGARNVSRSPRSLAEVPPESGLEAMRLSELVDEYRVALRVAGRSPRTIRWYGDHLAEFLRFLERSGDRATFAELRPPVVRRWLLEIGARHDPPLAPSSVAGRVRTLHAFGSWLEREFDLPNNPLRGVPVPRVPEQLVRSLREPDIRALLAAMDARCRVMGKGAKERVVPVGRKARRAIRQMLARRGNAVASAPLFTGADGRPLAPHGLQQIGRASRRERV